MISLFNAIVKRGHQPREGPIRRLMEELGLEILPNVGDDEDEDTESDEGGESSAPTDDEESSGEEPASN